MREVTDNELARLALLIGEITLKNGAATNRTEDTIARILKVKNYTMVEVYVVTTGLFFTIENEEGKETTYIKRVSDRMINLRIISKVNDISRKFCSEEISYDEAMELLQKIDEYETYSKLTLAVSWGVIAPGFAYAISHDLITSITGFFISFFAFFVYDFLSRKNISAFFNILITSAFFTYAALVVNDVTNIGYENIIVGCIMPLVPGIAFINAFRDIFNGDYLASVARIVDVGITTAAIAVGVVLSFNIHDFIIL
ncbi:MAG: threonine/serine exporter ThrE family protein [Lachnospirales bacterium]